MARIITVEARDHFADLINRTAYTKERVVLTRRGDDVVAMVPIEDLQLLEDLENRIDLEEARAALAEVEESGTIPLADIKARLGL